METQPPDLDACRQLFTELEFTSMLRDLEPAPAGGEALVEIIEDPTDAQAAAFYTAARAGGFAFALDAAAPAPEEEEEAPQSMSLLDVAEAAEKQENFAVGVCAETVSQAAEKSLDSIQTPEEHPSGAKAPSDYATVTARLKSCPDTKQQLRNETEQMPGSDTKLQSCPDANQHVETVVKSFSAGCVALRLALTPELRALLEDASVPKQAHDWKLALHALAAQGVELRGAVDDTMLLSYALNPTHAMQSLADVATSHGKSTPSTLAEGAAALRELTPALKVEVKTAGVESVYAEIDLPLAPVLFRMEQAGVRIDLGVLDGLSKSFAVELERVGERIFSLAGRRFNINSPKQLGEVLFTDLALPAPARRGKSKAVSTAQKVLEFLAEEHEVPRLVLEYRHLSKLKSTYIDALPSLADADSRVHTTFQEAATATGRLSSINPNLQNIPVRTELGREIRAAFTAAPGTELLSADYSQIELRLLAHFSGDPLLVHAYQTNEDIHTLTASEVFGVPIEKMDKETRNRAKAVNFGIVYGISPFGLAQQLGIPMSEAKQYIERYFARYAGVQAFIDKTLEATRKTGSVRTLFGRVRPIPDLENRNPNQRGFAERTAVNTPLQGTAADLIKLAMISIDRKLTERKLKTRMVLQVHDELIFEVPADEKAEVEAMVRAEMEGVVKLKVPLVADLAFGPNWRDL
jgi:DNA polymerase-1